MRTGARFPYRSHIATTIAFAAVDTLGFTGFTWLEQVSHGHVFLGRRFNISAANYAMHCHFKLVPTQRLLHLDHYLVATIDQASNCSDLLAHPYHTTPARPHRITLTVVMIITYSLLDQLEIIFDLKLSLKWLPLHCNCPQ